MGIQNQVTTASVPAKDAPYFGGLAIDVSAADANLTSNCRGVLVGVGGTLKVDFIDGSTVTFPSLAAGVYRFCVKRVYQVGTTATGIVVLF